MIFLLTLLILSVIWFGASFYFKVIKQCCTECLDLNFYLSMFTVVIIGVFFCCLMINRKVNITDYYECKKTPGVFW